MNKTCRYCGQLIVETKKNKHEIKSELGTLLGLKPKGKDISGNPYYDLDTTNGLLAMIKKVRRGLKK